MHRPTDGTSFRHRFARDRGFIDRREVMTHHEGSTRDSLEVRSWHCFVNGAVEKVFAFNPTTSSRGS